MAGNCNNFTAVYICVTIVAGMKYSLEDSGCFLIFYFLNDMRSLFEKGRHLSSYNLRIMVSIKNVYFCPCFLFCVF